MGCLRLIRSREAGSECQNTQAATDHPDWADLGGEGEHHHTKAVRETAKA